MPGRFEALDVFRQEVVESGVGHVLCLVSDEEIAKKSPDYLVALQRDEFPVKFLRNEIPDYGMPENPDTLKQALDLIRNRLDEGESVVIHCAAGHGRTGMVSVLLLTRMGIPLEQAIKIISLAGSAPDTQAQMNFVKMHASL